MFAFALITGLISDLDAEECSMSGAESAVYR